MSTIEYIVDLGPLGEVTLDVEYSYSAGKAGRMYDRFGDPGNPPEDAQFYILNIFYQGRDVVWLFEKMLSDNEDFFFSVVEQEEEVPDAQ